MLFYVLTYSNCDFNKIVYFGKVFFIVMGNLFVNANFHNSVNIRILIIKFFIHKC